MSLFKAAVRAFIAALAWITLCALPSAVQAEQGQDHPLIERYPGSSFTTSDVTEELTVLWFKTTDTPAKIMAWYREELSGWSEIESNGMAVLYKSPPGLEAKELADKPYVFTRSTTESKPVASEITVRLPKQ